MNTIVPTIGNSMLCIVSRNHLLYVFDSALADFSPKIGLRFLVSNGVGTVVTPGCGIGSWVVVCDTFEAYRLRESRFLGGDG